MRATSPMLCYFVYIIVKSLSFKKWFQFGNCSSVSNILCRRRKSFAENFLWFFFFICVCSHHIPSSLILCHRKLVMVVRVIVCPLLLLSTTYTPTHFLSHAYILCWCLLVFGCFRYQPTYGWLSMRTEQKTQRINQILCIYATAIGHKI